MVIVHQRCKSRQTGVDQLEELHDTLHRGVGARCFAKREGKRSALRRIRWSPLEHCGRKTADDQPRRLKSIGTGKQRERAAERIANDEWVFAAIRLGDLTQIRDQSVLTHVQARTSIRVPVTA